MIEYSTGNEPRPNYEQGNYQPLPPSTELDGFLAFIRENLMRRGQGPLQIELMPSVNALMERYASSRGPGRDRRAITRGKRGLDLEIATVCCSPSDNACSERYIRSMLC